MIRKSNAINSLVPNASFHLIGQKELIWHDSRPKPTEEEINSKIAELKAAEPMRLLRLERNRRLADVDWITLKAYSQKQDVAEDWVNYMQALRDLPATAEPTLDDIGNLTNITWPEVPE